MRPKTFEFIFGALKIVSAIAIIALIPLLWNLLRYLYKRILLCVKLSDFCRRNAFSLIPTHHLWMLGTKHGRKYDFYIETESTVYSVKLWDMVRHRSELHFTFDGQYYIRSFFSIPTRIWQLIRTPLDSKKRPIPQYEMRPEFGDEWRAKKFVPVLLVNPVGYDMKYDEKTGEHIICDGDNVSDFYIYSLSGLLNILDNGKASSASHAQLNGVSSLQ